MAPKQPLIDTDPRIAGLRRRAARQPPAPAAWDEPRAALAIERSGDGLVSID